MQWQRIHDYLASPLYNYELLASKSSVFTLIQKSNAAPKQEGFLLAASNDPEQGCNFRYANDSPLHIVSSAARALHRRMGGSWNAELLHSRFMMNFSMAEIELGRCLVCQKPPLASLSLFIYTPIKRSFRLICLVLLEGLKTYFFYVPCICSRYIRSLGTACGTEVSSVSKSHKRLL